MAVKTETPTENGLEVVNWADLKIKVGGRAGTRRGGLVDVKELVGETVTVYGLIERTRTDSKTNETRVTGYTAQVLTEKGEDLKVKLTDRLEDALVQAFDARPKAQFKVKVVTTGKTGRSVTFA